MTRFLRIAAIAGAVLLGSCDLFGPAPNDGPFTVELVDPDGDPIRGVAVHWFRDEPSPTATYAECVDEGCTRWRWETPPTGNVVIGTGWQVEEPVGCYWFGYGVRPVRLGDTPRGLLRLVVISDTIC